MFELKSWLASDYKSDFNEVVLSQETLIPVSTRALRTIGESVVFVEISTFFPINSHISAKWAIDHYVQCSVRYICDTLNLNRA